MGKIRHQNSEEQNFFSRIFYNCLFKTQEQAIRYENNYRFALNTAKYVNATTEKLSFFFAFKALKQDFHSKKFFKANFLPPPRKNRPRWALRPRERNFTLAFNIQGCTYGSQNLPDSRSPKALRALAALNYKTEKEPVRAAALGPFSL